jgi:hypothetical protein
MTKRMRSFLFLACLLAFLIVSLRLTEVRPLQLYVRKSSPLKLDFIQKNDRLKLELNLNF